MTDERRVYQRLTLTEPIDGWFGDFAIRLIDVSATGALVEYDDPIPDDARALLRFFWRSREIEVLAETVRTIERRLALGETDVGQRIGPRHVDEEGHGASAR